MLDEATRTAILKLKAQGHGSRAIAQALAVARSSVRRVIRSGEATVPPLIRAELAEAYRAPILQLYARNQGHLARAHKEPTQRAPRAPYPAPPPSCRTPRLGSARSRPAG